VADTQLSDIERQEILADLRAVKYDYDQDDNQWFLREPEGASGQMGQFKANWKRERPYANESQTLQQLTWANLGYRLARARPVRARWPDLKITEAFHFCMANVALLPEREKGNGSRPTSIGMSDLPGRRDRSTADEEELDEKTEETILLLESNEDSAVPIGKPAGVQQPVRVVGSRLGYARDADVRGWVLYHAKGICQRCGQKAPFLNSRDRPFLEVHHLLHLAKGGPDTVENTVALCPNCHRQLHLGKHRKKDLAALQAKLAATGS
jgi:hypothetical protein